MALATQKIIDECNELIRFDFDAIGAYDEAIEQIKDIEVVERLTSFRGDHENHVADLSAIVQRLGGSPPSKPGLRGIARKTLTKVAGLIGTEACLRAMESNENVLNQQYANRVKLDLPEDVLAVIRRNYQDEQRHLAWVREALRTKPWEAEHRVEP